MEEPRITPLARRLAEENGIDWRKLQGTGPGGTIVERDILAFLAKVMAGEVDLPPAPEPPPPPPPRPEELERAMSVLAKEGVPLEEVLPQKEKPEAPSDLLEEELEGLIDLDLDLDQAREEGEATLLTWPEHTPPTLAESELDLGPKETSLPVASQKGAEEPLLEESPLEPLEAWEEGELEALLEAEPQAETEVRPIQEEASGALPKAEPPGVAGLAAPIPAAPVQTPTPIRVHRVRIDLGPAQRAAEVLARALEKEEKTVLQALLVKAAEKALAELGLSQRALLGSLEGETLKGYALPPGGLSALAQGEESEEEGLLCLYSEEELHTGSPLLYLHPEGLLSLSGLEAQEAQGLLERVKAYLEEPLLLFV